MKIKPVVIAIILMLAILPACAPAIPAPFSTPALNAQTTTAELPDTGGNKMTPTQADPVTPDTQAAGAVTPGSTASSGSENATPMPGAPASTPYPPASLNDLSVTSTSLYTDPQGNYHIVGEVENNGKGAASNVLLSVTAQDGSGKSIIVDNNGKTLDNTSFSPMVPWLLPGGASPYDFSLPSNARKPAKYSVTPAGIQNQNLSSANVTVDHAQMKSLGNMAYYITGELVNHDPQPVLVVAMAGSLVDDKKQLLTANTVSVYNAYLAPAGDKNGQDRAPFSIGLDNPPRQPSDYKIYLYAEDTFPINAPKLTVTTANQYFDNQGQLHIAGTVTNNDAQAMAVSLVGGIYAKDGTVLDASSVDMPVGVNPGETLPYEISLFYNVSVNQDQADAIDHVSILPDISFTSPTTSTWTTLNSANENLSKANGAWTVSGTVENTTGKTLSDEIVIMGIYNSSGKLVAVSFNQVSFQGQEIAAGNRSDYSINTLLPANDAAQGYTYKIFARGLIK